MVEVSLTVGKLDASLALLLTKDHHLIEFPTILLPDNITTGSIVKINCTRDFELEDKEDLKFKSLQDEIYNTFGINEPKAPVLKTLNVTQTSCVLEWEPLELGSSSLKNLVLYKNGKQLSVIKNPLTKTSIKLSGLPIDTLYNFQLRLDTTSGKFYSEILELKTHKMTDLSGINVVIGDIDYSIEKFDKDDLTEIIDKIGAKLNNQVKINTTHYLCTKLNENDVQLANAKKMNIPIIRPEWLKACELERRIVGVSKFYLSSHSPIWLERDFWSKKSETVAQKETPEITKPLPSEPVETKKEEPGEVITPNEMYGNESIPQINVESDEKVSEPVEEAKPVETVAPVEPSETVVPEVVSSDFVTETTEPVEVENPEPVAEETTITETKSEEIPEKVENSVEEDKVPEESVAPVVEEEEEEASEEPVAAAATEESITKEVEETPEPEENPEATPEPPVVAASESDPEGTPEVADSDKTATPSASTKSKNKKKKKKGGKK